MDILLDHLLSDSYFTLNSILIHHQNLGIGNKVNESFIKCGYHSLI